MNNAANALSAPILLAIIHAPLPVRERFRWLLQLDRRLQDVRERAREPMIAQIRLAWWRNALNAPAATRPKGEPLLALLDQFGGDAILNHAALALIDAAELMLGEADSGPMVDAEAKRMHAICDAFTGWTVCDDSERQIVDKIAQFWIGQSASLPAKIPYKLRPLSILALVERLEQGNIATGILGAGARLNWHALTGR